jgi:hypothetical protein
MCIYRMINSGRFTGLDWLDEDKTIFKVPWIHPEEPGYDQERDAALFREWAMHSGKYRQDSDPTVWKINFRCAINGLKDIMEIKDMQTEDCRVYKVLPSRSKRRRPKVARQRAEPYPTSYATGVQGKSGEGSSTPVKYTQAGTIADTHSHTGHDSDLGASIRQFTSVPSITSPSGPFRFHAQAADDIKVDDIKVVDILSHLIDHPPTPPMPTTPPSNFSLLQIQIFYGSVIVHDEYVDCANVCRIISSDEFLPPAEYMTLYNNIVLPENHPDSSARDIFNAMQRGVLIEVFDSNIYVTPLCRIVVYCGSSSTDLAQPLEKEIRSIVFDYRGHFRPALEHSALVHSQSPSPYIILGLGQNWGRGRHVTQNLISIVITHTQARYDIDAIGPSHTVAPTTTMPFEMETIGINSEYFRNCAFWHQLASFTDPNATDDIEVSYNPETATSISSESSLEESSRHQLDTNGIIHCSLDLTIDCRDTYIYIPYSHERGPTMDYRPTPPPTPKLWAQF